MNRQNYENENERSIWKKSINFMYQRKDIKGLKELEEGPDHLDEDIMEILRKYIQELEKNEKVK